MDKNNINAYYLKICYNNNTKQGGKLWKKDIQLNMQ